MCVCVCVLVRVCECVPLVVQRGGHGVQRGADGLGAVPDEQQLGQPLLSALGCEPGLGVLVPAVLHGLLQGAHRLDPPPGQHREINNQTTSTKHNPPGQRGEINNQKTSTKHTPPPGTTQLDKETNNLTYTHTQRDNIVR